MALSDDLKGNLGGKTGKGTQITDKLVASVKADESVVLEIQANNSELIANAIDKALVAALESCGQLAERFAMDNLTRNHSVDTGRLRASITHQISESEKAVYIGTNVEYAPYVELGTERADPKPYLRPAVNDHSKEYEQIFQNAMKNAPGA